MDDVFKEFANNAREGNRPIILNIIFVCFFEEGGYLGSFPIFLHRTMVKGLLEKDCQDFMNFLCNDPQEFSRDLVGARGFVYINVF